MRTFNRILFQLAISTTLLCMLPLAMTQTKRTGPSVTSVTVTPNPVVLYVGQSLQLGLTITGTGSYTKQVTWSATGGLVSSTGYYTAPATPGAFNVTAKSVATGNPSSTILVQVNAIPTPGSSLAINEITTTPGVAVPVIWTATPVGSITLGDLNWSTTLGTATTPGDSAATSIYGPILTFVPPADAVVGSHVYKVWAVHKTIPCIQAFAFVNIVAPAPVPVLGPVISKVVVDSITATTARVTWSLDKVGTGQVAYGPTASYGTLSAPENSLTYNAHIQNLSGLTPATTYHFSVRSCDGVNFTGNCSTSPDAIFTTAAQ